MNRTAAIIFLAFVLGSSCSNKSAADECREDSTRTLLRTICAGNVAQLPSGRANVDLNAVVLTCAASVVADSECDSRSSGDLEDPGGYFE